MCKLDICIIAVSIVISETELAQTINAAALKVLAEEAKLLGAWLIHYSTDYVFAGDGKTPWQEDGATGPLGVYGETKLAGELAAGNIKPNSTMVPAVKPDNSKENASLSRVVPSGKVSMVDNCTGLTFVKIML